MREFWGLAGMSAPAPPSNVFIQWKGTDLCCDLRCLCGKHSHFDGDFAYVLKCPTCDRLWEMPTDVYPKLIESTDRTPLEVNGDDYDA